MSEIIREIAPGLKLVNAVSADNTFNEFIGAYFIDADKRAVIDIGPGSSVPGVLAALTRAGVLLESINYIILTHIHIDHGGGTGLAIKSLPNASVLVHPRGVRHIAEPTRLWQASLETLGDLARRYGEIEPVPAERITALEDGQQIDAGQGVVLNVLFTPGHAPHHLSLFEPRSRVLFSGDSAGVFSNGSLRLTTPPPFRLDEFLSSIERMIAFHPSIICYAHNGFYPDAVERLKTYREKVLAWYDIAKAGVETGKTALQVAADIRRADPALKYLDTVSKDIFDRDYDLIVSSALGLMGASSNS